VSEEQQFTVRCWGLFTTRHGVSGKIPLKAERTTSKLVADCVCQSTRMVNDSRDGHTESCRLESRARVPSTAFIVAVAKISLGVAATHERRFSALVERLSVEMAGLALHHITT
jgi:hypothetical protein